MHLQDILCFLFIIIILVSNYGFWESDDALLVNYNCHPYLLMWIYDVAEGTDKWGRGGSYLYTSTYIIIYLQIVERIIHSK